VYLLVFPPFTIVGGVFLGGWGLRAFLAMFRGRVFFVRVEGWVTIAQLFFFPNFVFPFLPQLCYFFQLIFLDYLLGGF